MIRSLRIAAAAAVLLLAAAGLRAQDTSRQESRREALRKEIAQLEQQIRENKTRSNSALGQLQLVRRQLAARRELVAESEREISSLSDTIAARQAEADRLQARLETMETYYRRLIRNAYKNRDARVWDLYILASENLGQGMRRYGYLRSLSARMNAQGREIRSERARLEERKARLDSLQMQARRLRDERATELGKLRGEEAKSRQLVSQLQKDQRKYKDQISQKRREVEALNRQIEKMIADAMGGGKDKTAQGGRKTDTKIDQALSKEFSANKGKLPWPVEGRVVSHFGRNPHPVYSKLEMPFNNGVGIAVEREAPVKAVFGGVVKQIVVVPGYNQCILVQHGEYFTFYCKMGSVAVKAGDKVKTGQVLGHVATIADETQLHFQLWKGREPQNPEKWLR